ncbi:MAG: hypothetical protein GY906_24195 [bacterium]|nr:hypothetical protein [bacterium]
MLYIGIDPGLDGAIAALDGRGSLIVSDMPTFQIDRGKKKKRDIDRVRLSTILKNRPEAVDRIVYIEKAQSMPGQGVSSMFSYGKGYGIALGILAAHQIPHFEIPPAKWKKVLGVPLGKDGARALASQLFPNHADKWPLKKHHGRAEAVLLAYYALHEQSNKLLQAPTC